MSDRSRPSYYTRRSLPVAVATVVGIISAALWVAGSILIGSRLGELWAGGRRQSIGNFRAEAEA